MTGQELRQIRVAAVLTMSEFADFAGITKSRLQQFEEERVPMCGDVAAKANQLQMALETGTIAALHEVDSDLSRRFPGGIMSEGARGI